jgi:HD-like signal output (HDOD) protein
LNLLEKNDSDGSILFEIINGDPILAAKTLELANTATYKRGGNMITLKEALTIVGIEAIKKLAMNECVRTFKNNTLESSEYLKYVRHSHAVSTVITNISKPGEIASLGQLSGLLHDITEIILSDLFPEQFRNAIQKCKKANLPFSDVISNELELSYGEVVKVVIRYLNIPIKLAEIISSYNGRLTHKFNNTIPVLNSINVSHSIANALGYSSISNDLIDIFPNDIIETFSENSEDIYLPKSEVKSEIESWLSILNIQDDAPKTTPNSKDFILYVKDNTFSNYDSIFILLNEYYKNVDLIGTEDLENQKDLKKYTMIVICIPVQDEIIESFINNIPEGLPIIVFSKNNNFISKSEDTFSDRHFNFNLPISRNLVLEILNSKATFHK